MSSNWVSERGCTTSVCLYINDKITDYQEYTNCHSVDLEKFKKRYMYVLKEKGIDSTCVRVEKTNRNVSWNEYVELNSNYNKKCVAEYIISSLKSVYGDRIRYKIDNDLEVIIGLGEHFFFNMTCRVDFENVFTRLELYCVSKCQGVTIRDEIFHLNDGEPDYFIKMLDLGDENYFKRFLDGISEQYDIKKFLRYDQGYIAPITYERYCMLNPYESGEYAPQHSGFVLFNECLGGYNASFISEDKFEPNKLGEDACRLYSIAKYLVEKRNFRVEEFSENAIILNKLVSNRETGKSYNVRHNLTYIHDEQSVSETAILFCKRLTRIGYTKPLNWENSSMMLDDNMERYLSVSDEYYNFIVKQVL